MLDRITHPCSITAAAVSSHELSMPKTNMPEPFYTTSNGHRNRARKIVVRHSPFLPCGAAFFNYFSRRKPRL